MNSSLNIKELIASMTLKEKVGQLNQKLYGWNTFKKTNDGYELTEEFKEHVKWGGGIGTLYGVFRADAWSGISFHNGISKEDSKKVIDMIRTYVNENTRLGLPVMFSEECPHGHQALAGEMYPCSIGLGATWNPHLVEKISEEISEELSIKGANLALVSCLDVLREPRWGRAEECYSEDPFLSSKYTEAIVKGYQKDDFKNGVAVVLKHLCAQGAPVGGHNSGAVNIGERELREIFLPPVEAGVKSGALAVMAAYNEIDGIPCHGNKKLLTDILRGEYGYEGLVMADGCALDRLVNMTGNKELAAKLALESGVDLSLWDDIYTCLENAVDTGVIDEKDIDRAVERILYVKNKLGLFDEKIEVEKEVNPSLNNKQAAAESIVMLKNDDALPLKNIKSVAVIGPNADNKYNQLGDYASYQNPEDIITVLEGIKKFVGENINVNYAKGCDIRDKSKEGFEEAINIAKNSDVAIVVVGGSSARNFTMEFDSNGAVKTSYDKSEMNCGENVDLANLDLDGVQADLIREIKSTGVKVITVLIQGRPHAIENIKEYSDAILCAWYPGKFGGEVISETIFGVNNPSGKLAVSYPRSSMQLPCYYNGKTYGIKVDYSDMPGAAAYPFGYGLSYSKFEYENLRLNTNKIKLEHLESGEEILVSVDITNNSDIDGFEVAQMYIVDVESTITQRDCELKGFKKVFIKAREKQTVTMSLSKEELKIWNRDFKNVIEKGNIIVRVGRNSNDYLEIKFEIF